MMSQIECLICKTLYKKITQTHLKKHGILPNEYKKKFGIKTTNCEELFFKEQCRARNNQFEKVVAGLNKDGFKLLTPKESYLGVHFKNELLCMKCNTKFFCKLGDKRKIICRQCIPFKKRSEFKFTYVNILDGFSFLKEEIGNKINGIYVIKNNINGKFYLGSSDNIRKRWSEHKKKLNKNIHINPRLQNAWSKYGGENFSFYIIEECEKDALLIREQFYLDTFKPYLQTIGYNICETACGGDNITNNPNKDAFIQKMTNLFSGEKNPMFGKKHSLDSRIKQKNAAKGRFSLRWFCDKFGEHDGKIKWEERRNFLKNRKINYSYSNKNNGKICKKRTDLDRVKMSAGKSIVKENKEDILNDINLNTMTITELSKKYGVSSTTLKRLKKYMGRCVNYI